MRIRLAQSALPASTQHIRRSGAHEKLSADSSELHARGSRSARIQHGRPYAARSAAPATARRPARGTAARMRCATFPQRGRMGHTPLAALAARARCPPDTPGSCSTRVPARAPGSAPHAKPEWAPRGPCPWPSVEKPTARTDRPDGPAAVRYTSVDPATYRPAVTYRDTRRDKKKTAPRVRSGCRRPLCVRKHRVRGPCGPRTEAERATDGRGRGHGRTRKRPRTGPVGAVTPTVRPALCL